MTLPAFLLNEIALVALFTYYEETIEDKDLFNRTELLSSLHLFQY